MSDIAISAPVAAADSFPAFYAEHYSAVTGYAYQLTRDLELARDVSQEAFTRLLARWVSIREPRPYLFHVATNLARDAWKSRMKRNRVVEAIGVRDGDEVAGPDTSVADAVDRLPRRHREVVLLFYYSDLPLTEVAAAVRRPEGTVKRLLAEARERLAASLEDPR